jgi:dienelactone hydrolase
MLRYLPILLACTVASAADPAPIQSASVAEWKTKRGELRAEWEKVLGKFPAVRVPLDAKLEAVDDFPTYTRRKVSYAIEDGVREDAVLFVPKPVPSKAPAVVVFHPTLKAHYAQVAGYDTSVPDKLMGPQLAERGYIVVCPRCFIFDDDADYKGNVAKMQARHPDWLGSTRMTWDGIRAVDFLESLPEVDRERIGAIGHSLGAKEALYAAAFDERVKAAVSCEGGVGLALSNWHDVWYLGPKIKEPGFARDHHELLALAAPRAVLVIGGGSADGDPSLPYLEAARPIYKLLGTDGALRFFNHGQGHKYPPEARKVAEPFLDEYLKRP